MDAKILEEMYRRKATFEVKGYFATATLLVDCQMHIWDGSHPVEEHTTTRMAKAGSKVLIASVSRFGDIGIRDDRLDKAEYGYYARVDPDILVDVQFLPENP